MDNVALPVNHNVAIMAVSNRKKVSEETVRSQAANEVSLSLLKATAEVPLVEVAQIGELGFFHPQHLLLERINRYSVRHKLNHGR